MLPVILIGVGRLREKWEKDACGEYVKRLGRYCAFEMREVSDQPEPAALSDAAIKQVKDREGEAILQCIRPTDRVVALCIDGKSYDSEGFSAQLERWSMDGRRLVFVIGGSLGLGDNVLARADERLSFSRFTFPHQLMRVILLEQVYRGFKISAGERYHK